MQRLARHLFTVVAAASLALCVLLMTSLLAGCYEEDQLYHLTRRFENGRWRYVVWGVASAQGRLTFHRNDGSSGEDEASRREFVERFGHEPTGWRIEWEPLPERGLIFSRDRWWNRLGFEYADMAGPRLQQPGNTTRTRQVVIPVALPLLATAVPPLLWVRGRVVRRHRTRRGECPACGYDLRATPARCPECGTPAA